MNELTAVRDIERMLRDKWPAASSPDFSHAVMSRLPSPSVPERKKTSWIPGFSGGVVIVSSLFLVNFSDSFAWMVRVMGDEFVIPVNIVLGLCLTCYLGGCIASQSSRLSHYLHHGGKP
jgi:cytochrome c oxidase assembly factor CtaG